jgi:ribosomal protein S18 acetylase RimI-like enzyme
MTIRTASGPDDSGAVRALDDAAFPLGDADVVRAEPGELEEGVSRGDVHVLQRGDRVVAYAQVDSHDPRHLYISGVAVHPDFQSAGLGTYLISQLIHRQTQNLKQIPLTVVSSPRNHRMVTLLLHQGFAVRWGLRDFFGPGIHRFGFQLGRTADQGPGDGNRKAIRFVPADRLEEVLSLVATEGLVIRDLVRTASGPTYLLSAERPGEFLPCLPPEGATEATQIHSADR